MVTVETLFSALALAAPDDGVRRSTSLPGTSRYMRELTGKMIIPSSRIRLMDTLGHGMNHSKLQHTCDGKPG